ncbi:hypothetical protein Emed_004258 [Eimeria media]
MSSSPLLRPLLLLLLLLLGALLQQKVVRAYTASDASGSRALGPLSLVAQIHNSSSRKTGSSSSSSSSSCSSSSSSSSSRVASCNFKPGAFLSMESSPSHPVSSANKALGVSPLSSSSSSSNTGDVPSETPEDVKAEIRRRRLANPLSASRPSQNDSLRLSLLGPKAFASLVGKGAPGAPQPSPADSFAVPVWVMRQAGRYLPEFRAIRAQHKFLTPLAAVAAAALAPAAAGVTPAAAAAVTPAAAAFVPAAATPAAAAATPAAAAATPAAAGFTPYPLLAAEVTLQPLRRFPDLDAVIIFSDILVIPEAMGMPLSFEEGAGPRFAWRLETPEDIKRLDTKFDVEKKLAVWIPATIWFCRSGICITNECLYLPRLNESLLLCSRGYVFDAIYATVEQLNGRVPLIGFCGAPLTLLCYMVEGGAPSKGLHICKQFLFNHPDAALLLLKDIAAAAAQYLIKQVDAGAQVLQVFDTNAGSFSPEVYRQFGSPFLEEIAEQVSAARPGVPLIAFPKDQALPSLVSSKFAAVSLGWGAQRDAAKALFQRGAPLRARPPLDDPQVKALQGNLDPQILYAPDEVIRQQTAEMPGRYVANLGHGMEPGMDPRKLGVFIQAVKETAAQIQREYSQATRSRPAS